MGLGSPSLGSAPNNTQPRQAMASNADESNDDHKILFVNAPAPADGDQERSPCSPDVSPPKPPVEYLKSNPRSRQLRQASFLDNQSPITGNGHLSPPLTLPPRSDSGRTDISFASTRSVHDRGLENHAAWVSSHPQGPAPHRDILGETPVTLGSLTEAIFHKMDEFNGDPGKLFLPLDVLSALINPTSIKELLESKDFSSEDLSPEDITRILQGIFGEQTCNPQQKPNLERIFTILIMIGRAKEIRKFISSGINDSILPLLPRNISRRSSDEDSGLFSGGKTDIDDAKLQGCLLKVNLDRNEKTLFRTYQKSIYVPFFQFPGEQLNVSFYDLDSDCVLPFIEVGEPKDGGCGSVQKIRIHPAHHNIEDAPPGISFAVKTLYRKSDDEMFKNEVKAFEKLAHETKPSFPDHLMHLELAYRHDDNCCLIFPWANGNLREYWRSHQKSPGDRDDVVWFFKQCLGIALGLSRLHNPTSYAIAHTPKDGPVDTEETIEDRFQQAEYGRHGDIKPENILWFDNHQGDSDHLVISDFGLTEFKSFWSRSYFTPSKIPGASGTHQPPDLSLPDKVTRRYDIWSLGCVFLELTSWLLCGSDAPAKFEDERLTPDPGIQEDYTDDKFFYFETTGKGSPYPKVKPCVLEWIQSLHALDTCPMSVHDFLDIVQMKMLRVMAADRSDSRRIREDLRDIYKRCEQEDLYATKGEPRKFSEELATPVQQESPESEDTPQPDLYPKMTVEMQRSSSVGRRQGPETKLGDAGEGAQDVELGFEEQDLLAEPTHTTLQTVQQLAAIINAGTTTRSKQPGAPELDINDSPPSDSQRLQRHSDSVSPEFLHGADELRVESVAATATFHDKGTDEQQQESSASRISVPEASPTSSTRNSEPENGTAAPVLLHSKETVSHGTQTQPRKSWMRQILRRLGCFSK